MLPFWCFYLKIKLKFSILFVYICIIFLSFGLFTTCTGDVVKAVVKNVTSVSPTTKANIAVPTPQTPAKAIYQPIKKSATQVQSVPKADGPIKVFLHIGIPKTGCTHFQKFIVTYIEYLKNYTFCYPYVPPLNNKSMSRLAFDIRSGEKNLTIHQEQINRCLALPNPSHILISAENIASLPEEKLQILKSLFPQTVGGRKVEIIILMAYREWLTRIYSHYTQEAKVTIYRAGPVSEFIYEGYGHVEGNLDFDLPAMVQRFDKVFGEKNVLLFDYLSIVNMKKDIAHVYLCETIHIFCDKTEPLNKQTTYENVRPLAHILHLIGMVRDYVHFQGYKWNHQGNVGRIARLILAEYTERNLTLPVRVSRLTLLHPYAMRLDDEFRRLYEPRLRYSNRTVSQTAMVSLEAFEINEKIFYSDEVWIEWLKKEFDSLKQRNWVVPKKIGGQKKGKGKVKAG